MIVSPVPVLVATCVAGAILAAGGIHFEVVLFATISGGVFADLVRRARREPMQSSRDVTDSLMALAFLVILLAAAYDRGRGMGAPRWDGATLRWTGMTLIAAGLGLRWMSTRELGSNFSMHLRVHEEQQLVDTGPYRWIRHPNYAALSLIAVGLALVWASPLALAATLLVWMPVVCVRMKREEQMLTERFGARYREYMRRTWRLLAGIY